MKTIRDLNPPNKRLALVLSFMLALTLISCVGPPNNRPQNAKETILVHGEVFVDGNPGTGVRVTLYPVGGMDPQNPTLTVGRTGKGSTFELGTYSVNDGAPVGEYHLTFFQTDIDEIQDIFGDPVDLLHGKYEDPKESEFTVTIRPLEGDEEFLDIGRFDLTTDGSKK